MVTKLGASNFNNLKKCNSNDYWNSQSAWNIFWDFYDRNVTAVSQKKLNFSARLISFFSLLRNTKLAN